MKKKINATGVLLFAIFFLMPSLCLSDQEIPNLVGHWMVKSEGATLVRDNNLGKSSHWGENQTTLEAEAVITNQKGRVIYGTFKSSRATEKFLAIIGHNNKSLYIADEDGFLNGSIINKDTIETFYRQMNPQQTVVAVGKWTRKK